MNKGLTRLALVFLGCVSAVAAVVAPVQGADTGTDTMVPAVLPPTTATSAASAADPTAAVVLARLRKRYPATRFDAVRASEIGGLYEVVMGRNIAYVEPQGRYFVFGHIYDLPANTDLTASRVSTLQAVAPGRLPAADGIVIRRSDQPTYRLSVFSDPACGYCRLLEKTLASLPDIEVTVYLLPLQEGSEEQASQVWCAADRSQAWQARMLASSPADTSVPATCDTSVFARNRALAAQLGIHGTPAIISSDGRMQSGALDRVALMAWLSLNPTVSLTERTQ